MPKRPKTEFSFNTPGFSPEEVRRIYKAFALFEDKSTGKINMRLFKEELESLNYNETNPILFQLISNIEEEGELDFEKFMQELSSNLGFPKNENEEETEIESRERINKLFDLWSSNEDYLDREKLRQLAEEFEVPMEEREINELIERAASNNQEITKEDFYNIMVKKQI